LAGQGLRPETLVWRDGLAEWQAARNLPELSDVLPAQPAAGEAAGETTAIPLAPERAYPREPSAPAFYPQQPYAYGYAPPPGYPGAPGSLLAYGGYTPPVTQSSGLAIASMILGILSLPLLWAYCAGLPCAIVAVVLGHIARRRARRNEAGGGGMALAGLICAYISLALVLAFVILVGVVLLNSKL
jgi:hypothetical protein